MRLVEFGHSTNPHKRFMVKFMEPERTVYFGSNLHLNTYVDHGNEDLREIHLKRRHAYLPERSSINEEIMTTVILWGPTRSVEGNLSKFLDFFRIVDDR
jgi:hypothetical protein